MSIFLQNHPVFKRRFAPGSVPASLSFAKGVRKVNNTEGMDINGIPQEKVARPPASYSPSKELIVNRTIIIFACVCVSIATIPLLAEESARTKPAPNYQATLPVGEPGVLATVGDVKITYEQIRNILDKLPYKPSRMKRGQLMGKHLQEILMAELTHSYLKHNNIGYLEQDLTEIKARFDEMAEKHNKLAKMTRRQKVTPRDLMEARGLTEERLRDQARYRRHFDNSFDEDAIKAFIKANPSFFDGTRIQMQHILIACIPLAPTTQQKAIIAGLKKIRADILSGKIKFKDAARKYSNSFDPTDDNLKMFAFTELPSPLAMAAFRTKVGEMSGIVRTNFGFYLVKVTKRIKGNAPPPPNAAGIAINTFGSQLLNKIFDQALTIAPIVIYRKPPKP